MKHISMALAFLIVVAGPFTPAFAQSSSQVKRQQPSVSTSNEELYHVLIVKAAPGKLRDMIDAYLNAPADPNASAPPLLLRHVEGDDWDLLVLTPLGKEDKLTLAAPSAAEQQFIQRVRPLAARHTDTFAAGPRWTDTLAALSGGVTDSAVVPTSGSSAPRETTSGRSAAPDKSVYIVTTYRALPGHRDQLEQTVRKLAALNPGRMVTLAHMEGAPWDLLTVERYDSWATLADDEANPNMQTLRTQGFSSPDGPSFELREHMAEHHDTIAVRVKGGGGNK
ncbi:MAG: hypothetical protein ACM3NQ_09070 [Bacteroidales bacterium]